MTRMTVLLQIRSSRLVTLQCALKQRAFSRLLRLAA